MLANKTKTELLAEAHSAGIKGRHKMRTESPFWSFAIHDGHQISPLLLPYLNIDEHTRLREEDPYTATIGELAVNRLVIDTSRFQSDVNRTSSDSIYLRPDQSWGLEVWQETPPDAYLDILYRQHQAFYRTIEHHLERTIQQYGYFIVLDIHSYNCRRQGATNPVNIQTDPQINLGTAYVHPKWSELTNLLVAFIQSQSLYEQEIDIRENVKFKGGNLGRHLNDLYGERGCVWSIEFRKDFMDEWTGEPNIQRIAACKQLMINTLQNLKNHTPYA
jgi:N-formylglutamate amidohydrolase